MEKHRLKTTNDISNRKEEQKNKVSEHKYEGRVRCKRISKGGVGATREAAKDKDAMLDSKVHWSHVHAHLKHKAMGGMKEKCP